MRVKSVLRSSITKKIIWTVFLIFIYVLGSKLTLPFVDLTKSLSLGGVSGTLEFSSAIMGGGLRSLNIFSLGLSPWMSSMLLWRMFTSSKRLNIDNVPGNVLERRKMYLTLTISLIQALAISLYLPLQSNVDSVMVIILNTTILIAGAFFLIWLADINSVMGLGSSTTIMMVGMILYLPADISQSFKQLHLGVEWIVGLVVFSLIFLYVAVVVERAVYKVPVNKIGIHNEFKNYSFLDVKINPAGGMPIMYAMTLVSVPQYILLLLALLYPKATWITDATNALQMGTPVWLLVYVTTIFLLAIAFAYINVNGEEISEKMQKSAEYINNVYPGKPTAKYINQIVQRLGIVGATYLVLTTTTPMIIVLWNIKFLRLSMIPGMFMIFVGMVFMIKEEIKALRLNENYTKLF